ncbi:MAG: preprotein translocase subunit YajC [Lachnospiraceae bacterium]|nr:preprotein translocase subunit YajC [Lachnospiraceae bacterium]
MNYLVMATSDSGSMLWIVIYIVFFAVLMYFLAIRPQKKQEKQQKAMLETLEVGDAVLTTAGFYGSVIDIADDTVIVEFGNNRNCRIPMQKSAIVEVEKANQEA